MPNVNLWLCKPEWLNFFTTVFISPKLSKKLSSHYHVDYIQSLFLMLNGISSGFFFGMIETLVNDRESFFLILEKSKEIVNRKT